MDVREGGGAGGVIRGEGAMRVTGCLPGSRGGHKGGGGDAGHRLPLGPSSQASGHPPREPCMNMGRGEQEEVSRVWFWLQFVKCKL